MFKKKDPTPDPVLENLDAEIGRAHNSIASLSAGDEDYTRGVDQLVKLYALRVEHLNKRKRVSSDTMATIAGNVVVTLMVVGHERANVITSQVHKFLVKSK